MNTSYLLVVVLSARSNVYRVVMVVCIVGTASLMVQNPLCVIVFIELSHVQSPLLSSYHRTYLSIAICVWLALCV